MKPTKENIATIINGLEEFAEHMAEIQSFNPQEFVNFMEPKFEAAGYREKPTLGERSNILILTEIGAGDFISTTGAIREIRRLYPDARITLAVHPRTFQLAECCPYVDEIIVDPLNDILDRNFLKLYSVTMETSRKIIEQKFDICFAFGIHANTPLLMYMSGARFRVTFVYHENLKNAQNPHTLISHILRLATHLFPCSNYGGHHADDAFALIENFLHLPIVNRKLEVWYTPADIGIVKSYLRNVSKPIYALCMGGSGQNKHYPPEKYARLLEMIHREEPTATFVILGGGQADLKSAELLKNAVPEINIIDLTNKINYRQSAAVLSFCDMYIGNDTGTMHLAAVANCPVLEPNCFAADLPLLLYDIPRCWYPYNVPSVIVQPEHALPECKNIKFHFEFGCAAPFPHCITQINPETLLHGFHLLKGRIAEKINEPLYIH